MKAIKLGHLENAKILIREGADLKQVDSDGISAVDYIIANRIRILMEELYRINYLELDSDILNKRKNDSFTIKEKIESKNITEQDLVEHNTTKSNYSDKNLTNNLDYNDYELSNKIKALNIKVKETNAKVDNLKLQNTMLKKKLKNKKNRSDCLLKSASEEDPIKNMVNSLTKEIEFYISWVDNYRRLSTNFFDNVFNNIEDHINSFFGDNINVCISGSYQNGLVMPWSDLNLVVTFPNDHRNDSRRRSLITDSVKKFGKVLRSDKSLIKSCELEERSSLLILKLELTKQFRNQNVEVIFKYYVNSSYPTNEEIISEYLTEYPLSKPLYVMFRSVLHRSKLDDPSLNGLKSVAIFLMVVAFLQQIENSSVSLGQLFINFLFFYSYSFDLYRDYVQPYPVKGHVRAPFSVKDPHRKIHTLMVVNPYNEEIILTKSFKRSAELKQLLRLVYISLFSRCNCMIKKNLTISPKKKSKNMIKSVNDDNDTDIVEDPLDRFKSIVVRYLGKISKRGPKLSLCLDVNEPRFNGRGSFNYVKNVTQDLFEEELLFKHTKSNMKPSKFILHTLLNYNYSSNFNI